MRKVLCTVGMVLVFGGAVARATDVINQDNKPYKVKVQGEGNLSISYHEVRAGGSMYGLCGYSFCTFEIPGSKVTAKKDAVLKIHNGKFVTN